MNCHACGEPLDGALVDLRFSEFTGASALNGVTFTCHARCIRLVIPERVHLTPRIPDPVAEPRLVEVEWDPQGWAVICRLHGEVGLKADREDAEDGAAIHLARHGLVAA